VRTLAIAAHAFRECVRQPVYLLLIALGAILILLGTQFGVFHFSRQTKMVIDLGLPTILITSIIIALYAASSSVAAEIEKKTALAILSKPVRRESFVAGKFLGVAAASLLALAALTVVLLATVRALDRGSGLVYWGSLSAALVAAGLLTWWARRSWRLGLSAALLAGFGPTVAVWLVVLSASGSGWRWEIVAAAGLAGLEVFVFAAIAVALSTRLALLPNAFACAALFVVGNLSDYYYFSYQDASWARALKYLVPNLQKFNIFDRVTEGYAIPAQALAEVFLWAGLYAAAYAAFALLVGFLLFSERELL